MTSDLRAALTHALQPLLPPEHVAHTVDRLVNCAVEGERVMPVGTAVQIGLRFLPEPYKSAAEIAEAIAPLVSAWWQSRVVEVQAGSITVTEHR